VTAVGNNAENAEILNNEHIKRNQTLRSGGENGSVNTNELTKEHAIPKLPPLGLLFTHQ
jgi:hypothetical protein